jgi:hypothetical protein
MLQVQPWRAARRAAAPAARAWQDALLALLLAANRRSLIIQEKNAWSARHGPRLAFPILAARELVGERLRHGDDLA